MSDISPLPLLLALVSACGTSGSSDVQGDETDGAAPETTETSGTSDGATEMGSDSTSPDTTAGSTETGTAPDATGCSAHLQALHDCFPEDFPDEGNPDYVEEACGLYANELEVYGLDCVAASDEVLSCLSTLDCGELLPDEEEPPPQACREPLTAANAACPDVFPYCTFGTNAVGKDGGCNTTSTACIDGSTYAVACVSEDEVAQQCACLVDGAEVATAELSAAEGCLVVTFYEDAEVACGFPDRSLTR